MSALSGAGKIDVRKSLFWESPRAGCRLDAIIYGYTTVDGRRLLAMVAEEDLDQHQTTVGMTATSVRLAFSDDNGVTWTAEKPFGRMRETAEGHVYEAILALALDTRRDVCVLFYLRRLMKDPRQAKLDLKKYQLLHYRISRDGGRTWGDEKTVIQKGPQYDRTNWVRGVRYGDNAGFVCNCSIQLEDGTIVAPFQVWPWDEAKRRHSVIKESAMLLGTWNDDGTDLEWELSEYIRRAEGVFEPTVAQLRNGSLLAIMRSIPPAKYYSVSHDDGRTWCPSKRLEFDDGRALSSPSSISRLIQSSRTGKLYWIANFLPNWDPHCADVRSNTRRWLLQIGEVDEETCTIRRNTVTTIDESRDDGNPRQYSNFGIYEDRDTQHLVLTLCEATSLPVDASGVPESYRGAVATQETFTSHSYRYEIVL